MKSIVLSLSALAVASALAQTAPKEFPAEGTIPPAAAVKERFAGKVYAATLDDGTRWRLEYESNGYFFVDTSTGFRGTGDWHADDGSCARVCAAAPRRATSCGRSARCSTSSATAVIALTPK
jgi:hypothetical protein